MYKNLTAGEFWQRYQNHPNAVLLDVRTAEEVAEAAIPNHLHIDCTAPDLIEQLQRLDPEKAYFVYCRSGGRSARVCELLTQMGFKEVYNLAGGIIAHAQAGLPIVTQNDL